MEVRNDSKVGPPVLSPSKLVDHVATQLRADHQEWLRQLTAEPDRFAEVEETVHQAFQQLADQLVASLLAQATQPSPALAAAKKK
jgi:iron-sulfur cluster repair protein YtfE (RIC family)